MSDKSFGPIEAKAIMMELADTLLRPAAADIDRTEAYPFDHAKTLAEAGISGMTMPVAYGGRGASFETACVAVEEAAKACGISGRIVVDTNMGAVACDYGFWHRCAKARTAELCRDGDKPAICFTEPTAGSDATSMLTRADRSGDGYVLNGVKYWITGAGITRLYLVLAHVWDADTYQGIGSFMIEVGTPVCVSGIGYRRWVCAVSQRGICTLKNVRFLPPHCWCRLMACNGALDRSCAPITHKRIGAASVALGLAQGAYDGRLSYVDQREQFGRPISEFQGVHESWRICPSSCAPPAC